MIYAVSEGVNAFIIMIPIILFILFVCLWWHWTFKDSNRDVAAWREKKYGKAAFFFVLDNVLKVALMSFLFPFIALFLFVKLFSD